MKVLFLLNIIWLAGCNPLKTGTTIEQKITDVPIIINSVLPVQGSVVGGTRLTIKGSNFTSEMLITLGGLNCPGITLVSRSILECTIPPNAVSIVNVKVAHPNGKFAELKNAFSYISDVTAASGSAFNLGGSMISDPQGKMHGSFGEGISGAVLENSEATAVSGLEGALTK